MAKKKATKATKKAAPKTAAKKKPASKKAAPAQTGKLTGYEIAFLVLSYLGILVVIPYLFMPNRNEHLKFHLRQGMALCALYIIFWITVMIMGFLTPLIGMLELVVFIAGLIALVKSLMGEQWSIPYLQPLVDKMPKV